MKKALLSIPSAAGLLLLSTQFAFGATSITTCPEGQFSVLCNFTQAGFGGLIGTLITIVFVIAVVIALGFLIFGGIKWMTSGGDKAALDSARNHIVAAIVGLLIVFLSYFVLNVIMGFFGLSLSKLELPTLQIK